MEVAFKKERYDRFVPKWHDSFEGSFTTDCVIPDKMPDIRDLMDAEGTLLLRSKTTEAGSVIVTASVNGTVLYSPEQGGVLQSLPVVTPVEIRFDSPEIQEDCRVLCRMCVRSLEAKMVNSRKITICADVVAEIWCYEADTQELPTGMEKNEVSVHILKGTTSLVHISDVREKAFVITDQYALPAGISERPSIVSQRTEVHTEDVKFVSGKVVFRGHVSARLLLAGTESGELSHTQYETDFSQIMEVDASGDGLIPEITLQLTGVFFDPPAYDGSAGKIGAEIHMVAQCVCRKKQDIEYIKDLYSNKETLVPMYERLMYSDDVQAVTMRQTVSDRVEFAGEGEIVCAGASVSGITLQDDTVKTLVNVRLLCRQSSGEYMTIRSRLSAEFTTELSEDAELRNISVRIADIYCSGAAGTTDVRVVLQMDGWREVHKILSYVESAMAEENDRGAENAPSMTLVRKGKDADLWQLAKRYHSSPEAIEEANIENSSGLLLIPKSR